MNYLFETLGWGFPNRRLKIRDFEVVKPIGTNFLNAAIDFFCEQAGTEARILNEDSGVVSFTDNPKSEFSEGDTLFIFNEDKEWIFTADADLDLGLLFLNCPIPIEFSNRIDFDLAQQDFIIICKHRITKGERYYNQNVMREWIEAARIPNEKV